MINHDNYEEIMFSLVEGNVPEPERTRLLREIEADLFLKEEWEVWQQTMVVDNLLNYEAESAQFIRSFHSGTGGEDYGFVKLFYWVMPLAAVFLLFFSVKNLNKNEVINNYRPSSANNIKETAPGTTTGPTLKFSVNKPRHPYNQLSPVVLTPELDSSALATTAIVSQGNTDSLWRVAVDEPQHPEKIAARTQYRVSIKTEPLPQEIIQKTTETIYNENIPVSIGSLLTNTVMVLDLNPKGKTPVIRILGENRSEYSLNLEKDIYKK